MKRRVIGWGLAVVGVAVIGLSVWSRGRYWTLGAEGHGCVWAVSVTSGVVQWSFQRGAIDEYFPGGGWAIGSPPREGAWEWTWGTLTTVQPSWRAWGWEWMLVNQKSGWHRFAAAPIWFPGAAAGACGGLLVWWGRRARGVAGACAKCGYDLKGLGAGAVCPECGKGDGI